MRSALLVGGTGFVGRHTAAEFLDHGYEVTVLSRGTVEFGVPEWDAVEHVVGDRTDADVLADVTRRADPDVVVDCALYHPVDARTVVDVFADVARYVYVSSGGVYAAHEIPKREAETPLHGCTPEQAVDDTMATYGPRKAECDRLVAAAVADGMAAVTVRPSMVYGPQTTDRDGGAGPDTVPATWGGDVPGLQTHHDYWVDRVRRYDRVVVPGDGTAIWHRAYVEDVAAAIRTAAEAGDPGEAYNAADRRVCTVEDVVELVADALDTSVEVVHASERELARVGLDPDEFVLYHHLGSRYPHVLDTCKLASLGWDSTPVEVAMERTVTEAVASGRDGSAFDPGREAEARLVELLTAE
ncbi:NAD-dependent epimerase/dehydratase family protein [Salinirubellus salinus]|uniref:NAD-dependent epimerase/dehydratase family protein n=1 Tax=Salinirubellus salinus TaxID=1364945 RepID=A0A9E7UA90_9EURY|nr:NAD-dependent epimerase/dehydratase family protein [Salinirubellus salinus]UWM53584.1 NAD-dependent epimerase/dehydratase family protein [Salinirubellus salinus]